MEYADTHFKTEESLMNQYQVDARSRDRHHQIHEGFIARVSEMKYRAVDRGAIHADDLLSFLAGWLIHRVLGEDQSMARQIHAIDGGMTPEQAFWEAGGYRTAPSEEALTRLLIHLYKRLIHAQKNCLSPAYDRPADPSNTRRWLMECQTLLDDIKTDALPIPRIRPRRLTMFVSGWWLTWTRP
jgi:hypothetical protein